MHSTGFIDTVVKWNVDVANSFNNQESALEDYIQTSVVLKYNNCKEIVSAKIYICTTVKIAKIAKIHANKSRPKVSQQIISILCCCQC